MKQETWLLSNTTEFYGEPFVTTAKELSYLLLEAARFIERKDQFADSEIRITHGYEFDRLFVRVQLKDKI